MAASTRSICSTLKTSTTSPPWTRGGRPGRVTCQHSGENPPLAGQTPKPSDGTRTVDPFLSIFRRKQAGSIADERARNPLQIQRVKMDVRKRRIAAEMKLGDALWTRSRDKSA